MRNTYTRYHMCLMRVKSRRVSLKRRFDVKYSSCRQTSCLLGVSHWKLPRNITTLMWTTTVYSLSHVVDHPMSSPCCVDKAGPVLAYRIMYLNDVVPASSPMISLDIKYSTHLVWVDDPASRVLLARAAQQWGKQAAQWIRWLPCLHLRHYRAVLR